MINVSVFMSRNIVMNISFGSIARMVTMVTDVIFIKNFSNFRVSGRHLEFLKMLNGENFTTTCISLFTPLRVIISREKKFIREFWVLPFTAGLKVHISGLGLLFQTNTVVAIYEIFFL